MMGSSTASPGPLPKASVAAGDGGLSNGSSQFMFVASSPSAGGAPPSTIFEGGGGGPPPTMFAGGGGGPPAAIGAA